LTEVQPRKDADRRQRSSLEDNDADQESNRNHGHRIDGPWVFGLKQGSDCPYFWVERRDRNTLFPITERECAYDSVIHSDERPACSNLNATGTSLLQ